jgi:ATP-dependent RNA helicase DeaD
VNPAPTDGAPADARPAVDPLNLDDPTLESPVAESPSFATLQLAPVVLDALVELGHERPTPVQQAAIPVLLEGRDATVQAATGTGKTAAFALPIITRLLDGEASDHSRGARRRPRALVLVPTRELAVQVTDAFTAYGKGADLTTTAVYGGQHPAVQLAALRRGVDVVVATPGRALDHLRRGALDLAYVEIVVLDEADEMLDMGFAEDLEALLDAVPDTRQTVMFSATLPSRLGAIAKAHLRNPESLRLTGPSIADRDLPRITQKGYLVARHQFVAALARLLEHEAPDAALVFCATRSEVDEVTAALIRRGERAEALHGGMDQAQRDRVMARLRSGAAHLLVATDVAARGLDVDHLSHVVNLGLPTSAETYVHRIGRVGRAGRAGVALSLFEPRHRHRLNALERLTRAEIELAAIPSPDEVRSRQLERSVTELRRSAAELEDGHGPYQAAIADLVAEIGLEAVALAAVRLVHLERSAEVDDAEIPDLRPSKRPAGERNRDGRDGRNTRDRRESRRGDGDSDDRRPLSARTATSQVWVGLGREAGVRPGDLVGAIANETRLSGRDIGSVRVENRFSVVEVPASAEHEVIASLGRTMIRGRRATVRRFEATRSPRRGADLRNGRPKRTPTR